jgi:hypothetical protein
LTNNGLLPEMSRRQLFIVREDAVLRCVNAGVKIR